MAERNQLKRLLELSASQACIRDVTSAEQFVDLLRHHSLLGDVNLPPDMHDLVTGYIFANLAGGKKLEEFVANTLSPIPMPIFEEPLSPETSVDLGDVIALARFALTKWSFGRPPKNGN